MVKPSPFFTLVLGLWLGSTLTVLAVVGYSFAGIDRSLQSRQAVRSGRVLSDEPASGVGAEAVGELPQLVHVIPVVIAVREVAGPEEAIGSHIVHDRR